MTVPNAELNRQIARSRGYWLLDFDLGDRLWRFSDAELALNSRYGSGGTAVYVAGLADISFTLEAQSASVQLRSGDGQTWARARRRLGPLTGRPFTLSRWHSGDLEDAFLVLQGIVGDATFGDINDPTALTLRLVRDLEALSDLVPSPDMVVNDTTWGTSSVLPDTSIGRQYPIVIGHPGTDPHVSGTANPDPSTPALVVDVGGAGARPYIVAGHRVDATQVQVFGAKLNVNVTKSITHQTDDLGRTVATISLLTGEIGTTFPDPDDEILVGWSRRSGWGGGLVHNGQLVEALGDLLRWGSNQSRAIYDHGEMNARRSELNAYRVDTVINDPVRWEEWLQSGVLDLFEIEAVNGPRGVYYRRIRYTADRTQLRALLTTEIGGGGFRVERASSVTDSTDPVYNQITLEYDPQSMSSSTFRRRLTHGPDPERILGGSLVPGGAANEALVGTLLSRQSRQWFGLRPTTLRTVLISDPGTAALVLAQKTARHAMPAQMVSYVGGPELADLRKYDTVSLTDTSDGGYFVDALALVWDISIEGDSFRVLLRVPTDPISEPTLAT